MIYGQIKRKPYTVPLIVKRETMGELKKEFPDVIILNHKGVEE